MNTIGIKLVKDSTITFFSRILMTSISILTGVIIARALGPQGKGEYTILILIPNLVYIFSNLGINVANIYFVGSKKIDLDKIISTSVISSIFLGFAAIIFFFILTNYFHFSFLNKVNPYYLKITILIIPLLLFYNYFHTILQGKNLILKYNLIGIISSFTSLITLLLFLIFLNLGLQGVIISFFLTNIISCIFIAYFVLKIEKIKLRFSIKVFYELINFGIKGYFANLFGFLLYRIDMLLVLYYINTKEVGYYSIAVMIAEMLWYGASSISIPLSPLIASLNNSKSNTSITLIISRNIIFLTLICVFALLLVDRHLIKFLFGIAFLPAIFPLRWLMAGIVAQSLERILGADLLGRGYPKVAMVSSFFSLVVNIILNLILIPSYGISGAAISSSIGYTLACIITLVWFLKITGFSWIDTLIIKSCDLRGYKKYFLRFKF